MVDETVDRGAVISPCGQYRYAPCWAYGPLLEDLT